MGVKYLKPGEDFSPESFLPSFGFTGSSQGNANPRSHPTQDQNEFGDGTYLAAKSAGEPALARGGRVPRHPPRMPGSQKEIPVPKVAKAVAGALQVGKAIGQKMAQAGPQGALGAPAGGPPSLGGPPAMPGSMPGLRNGGKVKRFDIGGAVEAPPGGAMPGQEAGAMAKGGRVMDRNGGDHRYDSDASAAESAAHEQTVPGNMDSANPGQSDAEILRAHGYAGGGEVRMAAGGMMWKGNIEQGPGYTKMDIRPGDLDPSPGEDRRMLPGVTGSRKLQYMKGGSDPVSDVAASQRDSENPVMDKAKGGFIKGAIHHKGRMKNLAKEHGVSVHQEMEHDKGSKDPSLRGAANLGLRLTGGDLKPKRKG